MPQLIDIRKEAIRKLDQAEIPSARLDVDLLLEQLLGISSLDIILQPERILDDRQTAEFDLLLQRRVAREPISQILAKKDFWKMTFRVSSDCLTPRPDSETLIEAALNTISDRSASLTILDLGSGSGCLVLSLLGELPNSVGMAVDISDKALAIARSNAESLGFAGRCDFILGDWVSALSAGVRYDIIICNPPYIAPEEAGELEIDVYRYEPHQALFAEDGGLREYKTLARIIPSIIKAGGNVFLEIGHKQGREVVEIFQKTGAGNIRVIKDLAGRDRCIAMHF